MLKILLRTKFIVDVLILITLISHLANQTGTRRKTQGFCPPALGAEDFEMSIIPQNNTSHFASKTRTAQTCGYKYWTILALQIIIKRRSEYYRFFF